jgi:hypothetical protein
MKTKRKFDLLKVGAGWWRYAGFDIVNSTGLHNDIDSVYVVFDQSKPTPFNCLGGSMTLKSAAERIDKIITN